MPGPNPRPTHRRSRIWAPALCSLAILAAACSPQDTPRSQDTGSPSAVTPPAQWALTPEPRLQIGVAEGEEAYQLHRVTGSVRLPSGEIMVANAGSRQLRLFDARGRYLRSIGRDGEGPGEFRFPSRIRKLTPDSLVVWDQSLHRISYFDGEGSFLGARQLLPSLAELFPGDEWLMGRNWIDSPVSPQGREVIRRAVAAMPEADTIHTVRYLRVTEEGWIWAASRRPPADSAIDWVVYDLRGRQVATLQTPPRFQPHEIGPDYVLGRYLDDMDINYVRLYGLVKPQGTPSAPGLRPSMGAGIRENQARNGPAVSREVLAEVRSLVKNMASLQEIYYAQHYTYTTDVPSLFANSRGGPPEGIDVEILFAGNDGWMGIFTHQESGATCGLSYGYYVPMGWAPGEVICP